MAFGQTKATPIQEQQSCSPTMVTPPFHGTQLVLRPLLLGYHDNEVGRNRLLEILGAMMARSLVTILVWWSVCSGTFLVGLERCTAQTTERPLSFNRDIRPILSDKCLTCHGQDAKKREADLRLDTFEGATADLDGTRAIVPGDLANSELWVRVTSEDEDEVMPPPVSHKSLNDAEKSLLKQWITQGAPYQKHWAFEPIQKPAVPQITGVTHPIDAFLTERLQQVGLTPQPPADRETLIRRVALTLTGLPPTINEVDAYLADEAPEAYERMVDRYLASPRYGEEMASHWLDVARYADTHGLHLDNERLMWAYRDWVVKAFNDNLPFDQFTVWQVAGDLLPNPTTEQLVATGFNRCNVTTSEGGAIDAEFTYRYAVERTTTVAQAWLGLTAGCAVCHDHKYDPLPAKEFYALYAFFNSAADPAMDGNISTTSPFLKVPTPIQKATAESATAAEQAARQWLTSVATVISYQDPAASADATATKPIVEVLFDDVFPPGSVTRSSSRNAIAWRVDPPFAPAAGRRVIHQAHAMDCNDTVEFKLRPLTVPRDGRLEVMVRVDPQSVPASLALTVLGRKTITWKRADGGLVREGTTEPALAPGGRRGTGSRGNLGRGRGGRGRGNSRGRCRRSRRTGAGGARRVEERHRKLPSKRRPARGVRNRSSKSERQKVMQSLDEASLAGDTHDYQLPSLDLLVPPDDICFESQSKEVRSQGKNPGQPELRQLRVQRQGGRDRNRTGDRAVRSGTRSGVAALANHRPVR